MSLTSLLSSCGLLFAFTVTALAQGGFAGPVRPGVYVPDPQSPDSISRPGTVGDLGIYDYWSDSSGQVRAGGILVGKIAVKGESLPWDPISILIVCKDQTLAATQTDALGRFLIPITKSFCPPDSCNLTHSEQLPVEGCSVQADAPGFGSDPITITERNLRDDARLGTLIMFRKEGRGTGTAVSETYKSASPDALASFEKARKEFLEHKVDKAEDDLQKTVQTDPQFANAWYQLGNLQVAKERDEARNSYARALAADPKFVRPYEQLAFMDSQEGKWQQVLDDIHHELDLDPAGTRQTWYFSAMANFQLKNLDAAQDSAQKSIALDPQHTIPMNDRLIAIVLAKKGDYVGALDHLKKCLSYTPPGPDADLLKKQVKFMEQKTSASKVEPTH